MADQINAGRRHSANFATAPMPACHDGSQHGWPTWREPDRWTEQKMGRCITDWTCRLCGLVVHIDSSD